MPSLASRQNAPSAVQPLLNAFPLPNGRDLGNGTAAFSASYSDPSSLDSGSIRVDYLPWQRATIFGRLSIAPSELDQRGAGSQAYNTVERIEYRTQTLTIGSNQTLTARIINEFRFNYSRSRAHAIFSVGQFWRWHASFRFTALSSRHLRRILQRSGFSLTRPRTGLAGIPAHSATT